MLINKNTHNYFVDLDVKFLYFRQFIPKLTLLKFFNKLIDRQIDLCTHKSLIFLCIKFPFKRKLQNIINHFKHHIVSISTQFKSIFKRRLLHRSHTKMFALNALFFLLCYQIAYPQNNFSACVNSIIKTNFKQTAILIENSDLNFDFDYSIPLIRTDSRTDVLQLQEQKYDNIIVQSENAISLNETIQWLKSIENFNSRAKYLILLKQNNDVNNTASLLWLNNLYKSIIVVENTERYAELYGINSKLFECGKFVFASKISVCTDGDMKNRNLVFTKNIYKDLKNCELVILWSAVAPWVIEPNAENNPGILVSVMNLIGIYQLFFMLLK